MNIEQERAAFEWWASDEGESPRATERAGGCYKLAQIQSYWVAWQARAALDSEQQPDVTQLVEALEACDTALFCDLKTDEEKSTFFLSGRGYETGVIAQAIQNDVAMAYHRCSEYRKEMEALQAECERLRKDAERYPHIRGGNQWVVAATQTGFHVDGEHLDELIDSEMEQ